MQEIATFYPPEYWWKASDGALKRVEAFYRRIVLRDHIRFICATVAQIDFRGRPPRLLDVGCGSGTILGVLKRRGFDVIGVDPSSDASQIAYDQNAVEVKVGSLNDAKFREGSVDVITMFHVLEHVTNPRDVLLEVRRVLRSDGRLIVQVPNIQSWQSRMLGARWYGLDIPRHVIDYSTQSICRLLGESGFAIRRTKHFNLRDNAPALASSLLPSFDPLSRAVHQHRDGRPESRAAAWFRHLAYLVLVVLSYPFTLLEAGFRRGGTVMIEASKS